MLEEDLTQQVSVYGRGWQEEWGKFRVRAWGCEKKNPERNPRKRRTEVLSSPLQLWALGADVPCVFQARAQPRLVGQEQEVEGLHPQVLEVAAAAVVEGDLQTHAKGTCHSWARAHAEKQDLQRKFLYGL